MPTQQHSVKIMTDELLGLSEREAVFCFVFLTQLLQTGLFSENRIKLVFKSESVSIDLLLELNSDSTE